MRRRTGTAPQLTPTRHAASFRVGCPAAAATTTMHPASSKPMEVAAVACRAGLLARARPGSRPRTRRFAVGPAPSAARRRLLVASLGVGEPLPAQSLLCEEAVALEVGVGEPLPARSLGEDAVALEVIRCRLAVGRCLVGLLPYHKLRSRIRDQTFAQLYEVH